MKKTKITITVIIVLLFPCIVISQSSTKKITFLPQWFPQSQFAGYYVAKELGLYTKYGLDVTIKTGGPDVNTTELLNNGSTDFVTLFLTKGITERSEGVHLVNIAQISQSSALILVAKKTSGIQTLADINGKKVGLFRSDFQHVPRAFFKKYNLNVNIIPVSTGVTLFLVDGIDLLSVMWYNEYHRIFDSGLNYDELVTFFLSDYDLNIPEDGIYCLQSTYQEDPELCNSFVNATMEGWLYAFEHTDETLNIMLSYMSEARVSSNRAHQRWMLNRMKDIILPSGITRVSTFLQPEVFEATEKILIDSGFIKESVGYSQFYKPSGRYAEE